MTTNSAQAQVTHPKGGVFAWLRSISLWAGVVAGWAFILLLFGAAFLSNRTSPTTDSTRAETIAATATGILSSAAPAQRAAARAALTESAASGEGQTASNQAGAPALTPAPLIPAAVAAPATSSRTVAFVRPLDAACTMPPNQQPCDAATQKRWNGDLGAWQAQAEENHEPLPDEAGALDAAIKLRFRMGDPLARIDVAKAFGSAAVLITSASYQEAATTTAVQQVQVEIANLGLTFADLGNARLTDERGNVLMTLPPGVGLNGGKRCRLSTGIPAEGACAFVPSVSPWPGADAPGPLTLRSATGDPIDTIVPR